MNLELASGTVVYALNEILVAVFAVMIRDCPIPTPSYIITALPIRAPIVYDLLASVTEVAS